MVPFPNFLTYPNDYNFFRELINPKSSPFSLSSQNHELYKTWNGEAIINFKWRVYGGCYYGAIWVLYTVYYACFLFGASSKSTVSYDRKIFYTSTIYL